MNTQTRIIIIIVVPGHGGLSDKNTRGPCSFPEKMATCECDSKIDATIIVAILSRQEEWERLKPLARHKSPS